MNNRSLGLDTECDLVLDTRLMPGRPELAEAIRRLRCDLMAEHLGLPGEEILAADEQANSIIAMVEALRSSGRSLMPYEPSELNEVEKFIADNELLDPESPDEMFERLARRGLFRKSRFLRRHSAKR